MMTSPTRPIACESEDIIEKAPRSCRISSAAIVSFLMRDSAKATSSATPASRWWHTISMSRCSALGFPPEKGLRGELNRHWQAAHKTKGRRGPLKRDANAPANALCQEYDGGRGSEHVVS